MIIGKEQKDKVKYTHESRRKIRSGKENGFAGLSGRLESERIRCPVRSRVDDRSQPRKWVSKWNASCLRDHQLEKVETKSGKKLMSKRGIIERFAW